MKEERELSLGFLFLSIGFQSGAVWANETWGSYCDPKETWAFITWTIIALWVFLEFGYAILFGVNLLGIGLLMVHLH